MCCSDELLLRRPILQHLSKLLPFRWIVHRAQIDFDLLATCLVASTTRPLPLALGHQSRATAHIVLHCDRLDALCVDQVLIEPFSSCPLGGAIISTTIEALLLVAETSEATFTPYHSCGLITAIVEICGAATFTVISMAQGDIFE